MTQALRLGSSTGRTLARRIHARPAWLRTLFVVALLLAGLAHFSAADATGRVEGVASCAGSTCHGRAEGDGKVVRQDELMRWQEPSSRGGAHSLAFSALSSNRGQRIAASLGLGAATAAPACLGCHATPAESRGNRYQLADGVGCEACHGASSGWIASHYAVGTSHADNLRMGLTPLEDPRTRARVCLDCHFGSPASGQFVTHSMMAAGHPRVVFELDLFSSLQQHWDADADYAARKGRVDPVRLWAVGQAEAVRRSLALFQTPRLASEGIFPEFYFFDCHSCHRGIDDNPARLRSFETNPGRPMTFGLPPYNDENIIMLSAVGAVLAPRQAAQFDVAARNFHAAMGQGQKPVAIAAARLATAAAALADAIASQSGNTDTAFRVIGTIAGKAIAPRFTDYTGSAQAVMAVDTLLNALVRDGRVSIGAAAGIRANVNRAYDAVSSPARYDPSGFRAALGSAARAIESLR